MSSTLALALWAKAVLWILGGAVGLFIVLLVVCLIWIVWVGKHWETG